MNVVGTDDEDLVKMKDHGAFKQPKVQQISAFIVAFIGLGYQATKRGGIALSRARIYRSAACERFGEETTCSRIVSHYVEGHAIDPNGYTATTCAIPACDSHL